MTQKATIKTELARFIEDAKLAYNDLRIEKINKPISEADIVSRLMTEEYGYGNRISEITEGNVSSIEIGNIVDDIVANGEKVIVGITKGGGVSTYYVEINGKYYPIHFSNSDINIKEDEAQDTAGGNDSVAFSAVSSNDNVVSANAKNVNGVLTVELEGKSRGTATITVTYGTAEPKTVEVNVKGKSLITIEAEKDENQVAKGIITSPSNLVAEYVDEAQITLGATPSGSYKFKGWYIGDNLLSTSANYNYTVPDNLASEITIVAKFKDTEPTDIFVSFEESTGTLRFYNSEHSNDSVEVIGTFYQNNGSNINLKNINYTYISNSTIPWKDSRANINKAIFVDEIVPLGTAYWFYECKNLSEIENIDNLDTSKVTNMEAMFQNCYYLTSLEVSGFDTSSVTKMGNMFYGCWRLTNLDVSGFNTSNVNSMSGMFQGCSGLTNLYVGNFKTANVTNMYLMFSSCRGIENIDLSNFDTSKVVSMTQMFSGCSALKKLDLSNFDTANVTNMCMMFQGCENLIELNLSGLDASKVTDMSYMFQRCKSLKELNLTGFKTREVTTMYRMFDTCNSLKQLDLSGFNISKVTDMHEMFLYCTSLENLNLSGLNASNVTNMSRMFQDCNSLKNIDFTGFATLKVENMGNMFSGCNSLVELNLSDFDTSNALQMWFMFEDCKELTTLNISSFNTSKVNTMSYIFKNCSKLTSIYVGNQFTTSALSGQYSDSGIFSGCTSLRGGNGTVFDGSKIDKTYARIDKEGQPGYFTDIKDKPSE